jgi:hypothetical protein
LIWIHRLLEVQEGQDIKNCERLHEVDGAIVGEGRYRKAFGEWKMCFGDAYQNLSCRIRA